MKNYKLEKTLNKNLFRVVDRNGDWVRYFHEPSKKYFRAVNYILESGYAKGQRFNEWLKNKPAEEVDRILKSAGDRGDSVHQAIVMLLNLKKVSRSLEVLAEDNRTKRTLANDEWDCLLAFSEFWNRHEAILIDKEMSVCFEKYEYAGTYDAIGILTKNCGVKTCPCDDFIGKKGLWDWKSSGGIYNSYGAQIAAYAKADGVKAEYTAIVRIGTNHKTTGGYEFQPYDEKETNKHFEEFLSALTIANADYKPFDPEKEIFEIPNVIEIAKPATGEMTKPKFNSRNGMALKNRKVVVRRKRKK